MHLEHIFCHLSLVSDAILCELKQGDGNATD